MKLILASASPRRIEILRALGAEVEVCPARIDEDAVGAGLPPLEMVAALSRAKADEVYARLGQPDLPVVAADTVVELDGVPLGKPKDEADARRMLRALSGREHTVRTGVSVLRKGEMPLTCMMSTVVFFKKLTEQEIDAYVATGEPMDKAGAYGIQGIGSLLVTGIDGDYFSVVGLPVAMLNDMLDGALLCGGAK